MLKYKYEVIVFCDKNTEKEYNVDDTAIGIHGLKDYCHLLKKLDELFFERQYSPNEDLLHGQQADDKGYVLIAVFRNEDGEKGLVHMDSMTNTRAYEPTEQLMAMLVDKDS